MRMLRLSNRFMVIGMAILAMLPLIVNAQQAPIDEAQRHHETALAAVEAQDYSRALEEFQATYAIRQAPRLLINIGLMHHRLGNDKDALFVYKTYLSAEPNAPPEIRADVEQRITQLQAAVEAKALASRQQASVTPTQNLERVQVKERPLYKNGWFWAFLGTASAAVAAGIAIAVTYPRGHSDTFAQTFPMLQIQF